MASPTPLLNGEECTDRDPTYSGQLLAFCLASAHHIHWQMEHGIHCCAQHSRPHLPIVLSPPTETETSHHASRLPLCPKRCNVLSKQSERPTQGRTLYDCPPVRLPTGTTAHRYMWRSAVLAASHIATCVASALDVALTATYLRCLVALPSMGCSVEEVAVADTVAMNQWDF